MRVLGIIPARGGSKAIPGKNLVDLGGIPLLHWTAHAALGSGLTATVLSTDDAAIAEAGRAAGIDVPFARPAELATDHASSIDVALHALDAVETSAEAFDAIMLLQPTSPFRTSADIDAAIAQLERTGSDSVISMVDVGGHHPARMKSLDGDRLVDPPYAEAVENQPRQELEPLLIRNGAIYLTRAAILRTRSFRGSDARAMIMPAERSINIDTPLDLIVARALVAEGTVPVPGRSGR
jgi:N-acylneuraminate cytidylyltransferase